MIAKRAALMGALPEGGAMASPSGSFVAPAASGSFTLQASPSFIDAGSPTAESPQVARIRRLRAASEALEAERHDAFATLRAAEEDG